MTTTFCSKLIDDAGEPTAVINFEPAADRQPVV